MVTLSNDHEGGSDGTTLSAAPVQRTTAALSAAGSLSADAVVSNMASADMYFAAPPQWEHYDRRSCDQGPAVDLRCWQHVQLRCGHGQPVRPRMTGEPFWVDVPPPASDPGWILGPDDST